MSSNTVCRDQYHLIGSSIHCDLLLVEGESNTLISPSLPATPLQPPAATCASYVTSPHTTCVSLQ